MGKMERVILIDFAEELHCNDDDFDEFIKDELEHVDSEGNLIDKREQKTKG